jgi:hypothetical protein
MVADNDYAVGSLSMRSVTALLEGHAIFVVEDDAQNGLTMWMPTGASPL